MRFGLTPLCPLPGRFYWPPQMRTVAEMTERMELNEDQDDPPPLPRTRRRRRHKRQRDPD